MKKGLKVFVNLSLLFALCLPAFSQPHQKSVETFLIDNFDTEKEWKWTVNASRFVAEGYPKFSTFPGIPNSLKPFQAEGVEPRVFGLQSAFNRKGDNWLEIIPMQGDKTYEIPFVGTVDHLDFWVWGANYLYYLEVMIRDSDGRVHVLPCGNLRFNGWRNVIVKIPGWISQHSRLRSGPRNLSLVGFRIRSDAAEYVDDFTFYMDNLKYMSNSLSFIYDGYELKDQSFDEAESGSAVPNNGSNSSTSEEN
ncbi:MAG: flagellar filament outer layer protein FlaA [Treponema sp.]|nr:flagellar filament outer layer protein FlaA [Treponema sp.]